MSRNYGMIRSAVLAGASFLALTTPVLAQDDTGADEKASTTAATGAGDIIVTARRMEERLQDVPISISVMTATQLSDRNIVNGQDLAQFTPALSANANFGPDNTSFSIRGFVQEIGTQPSVGVYFADVVAPRAGLAGFTAGDGVGPGSFFDLQNVQVLKGPQGTLQGRNTTGGAVLLVPQKPTRELEGYVEGSLGNYDLQQIQGVVNIPIGETFRMRLGVDRMTRDGYMNNTAYDAQDNRVGPDAFNNVDYIAARASFVADLSPNVENYTIVSYTDSKTNGNAQKLYAVAVNEEGLPLPGIATAGAAQLESQPGFYDIQSSLPNTFSRTKQWQIINTTTWQASDSLTVKNIASYAEFHQRVNSPQFATNFDASLIDPRIPAGYNFYIATMANAPGMPSADQRTITEELQLQGNNGALQWQAGAYYERSDPLGPIGVLTATNIACSGDPRNGNCLGALDFHSSHTRTQSVGVYAQGTYAITDKLNLTAGLRYTWDRVTDTSDYFAALPNGDPANCIRDEDIATNGRCTSHLKQKNDKPTWLLNLDYKPLDDVMVYAKWARGYRTGGVYPTAPVGFLNFGPEKVDNYEVGVKTSWQGAVPGMFNLAAYYNDFRNQQIQLGFVGIRQVLQGAGFPAEMYETFPNVPPTAGIANLGKSRIYGLEADLHLGPVAGLSLDVNYAYLNTKVKRVGDLPEGTDCLVGTPLAGTACYGGYMVGGEVLQAGAPLLLSPKHKLAVTGTYELPLPESVGKVSVGATYSYQSAQTVSYSDENHSTDLAGTAFENGVATAITDAYLGRLPGRGLLNVNATWNSVMESPLDLTFFMTNVTKKKYYNLVSGTFGYGVDFANVGAPQMWGVRARVRF